jgi:hypothetical protein
MNWILFAIIFFGYIGTMLVVEYRFVKKEKEYEDTRPTFHGSLIELIKEDKPEEPKKEVKQKIKII